MNVEVVALVDVRRAYLYGPSRRRVFVELRPEDYQPGDEHMCGLLHQRVFYRGFQHCHTCYAT